METFPAFSLILKEDWKKAVEKTKGMKGKKMSYYAVKKGRNPGIYDSWEECKAQVHGFKGAVFKKFKSKKKALAYIKEGNESAKASFSEENLPEGAFIAYVDGSFNKKTKSYGYGVVLFSSKGKEEFCGSSQGDFSSSRNVAGEVLAAKKAMALALERKAKSLCIYYDYAGIRHWALGEWKANLPLTKDYQSYAKEIREKLELSFEKVAAHTGVQWNERADQLAKKGCGLKEE